MLLSDAALAGRGSASYKFELNTTTRAEVAMSL